MKIKSLFLSTFLMFGTTKVCAEKGVLDRWRENQRNLENNDPSFGYVGFGLSFVSGAFELLRSTPIQIGKPNPVEASPVTFDPIPSNDTTGIGAFMASVHFGFVKALPNPLFTAGLFGGFNWSSLSEKWDTTANTPAVGYTKEGGGGVAIGSRAKSESTVASALHVPLSIEAGVHLGLWAHPDVMPFIRVGYSLMRGGVNRAPWVDRYRYSYFNGVVAGMGIDWLMTAHSSLSLSWDWVGYGARQVRNFDTKISYPYQGAADDNPTSRTYETMLQSSVKPFYMRTMLSIKYVLPNREDEDLN